MSEVERVNPNKIEFSDEEIAKSGLSENEIAAIREGNEQEAEALEAIINDDSQDDSADTAEQEEKPAKQAEKAEKAEESADPEQEPEVETTQATQQTELIPTIYADPVPEYDTKIQEINAKKVELKEKLNSGDIDIVEYEQKKDQLVSDETDLKIQQNAYLNAVKSNQALSAQRWQMQQESFMSDPRNKIYSSDDKLLSALDKEVRYLANDSDNQDKNGNWFLQEADRRVRALNNIVETKAETVKKVERKPDLSKIPKTLATLPAAEINESGNDEFAKLDDLSGMELEAQLAKMSKEQQERYLRG